MKKFAAALAALALTVCSGAAAQKADAAGTPACVLLRFSDDTRYDRIESAAALSDLVMEKLIASGRFRLMETMPIDARLEAQLYDERAREMANAERAILRGDYSAVFEDAGFDERRAQSIATAAAGQYIPPALTAPIGRMHGAEYLIQGTVINLGTGGWWDENVAAAASAVNMASGLLGSSLGSSAAADVIGFLGAVSVMKTGIGVQSDLRVIRADTGEVVWTKRVTSVADQKQIGVGLFTVGTTKLSANLYGQALDKAAQAVVDALVAGADEGKLFQHGVKS